MEIPGKQWEPDWEAELPEKNVVTYENDVVFISLPGYKLPSPAAASSSKIDDNSSAKNEEHKRGRPKGCGGRRAMGNWKPEDEKQLIEAMGHRDIVGLPMLHRARLILKQKHDLFPGRTALALTQHYKQITTPAQRAAALAESLKPPVDKVNWENLNCRQEKYSLEKDGLKLTALVIMEKGAIQRISAVVTPQTEGNSEVKAFLVNELPVDVLKLLYSLVEQLQQEPSQ